MEEFFKSLASQIAILIEAGAAVLIAFGAAEALWGMFRRVFTGGFKSGSRKAIWVRFGVWLLLGLEFGLGADIIRTAISPTWNDIGQLAAIATIRTFLNYFLEIDLDKYEASGADQA